MKYMFVQHYEGYYPCGIVVMYKGLFYYINGISDHDCKYYTIRGVKVREGIVSQDEGWGRAWIKHEELTPVSELPAGFINNSQWLKCA